MNAYELTIGCWVTGKKWREKPFKIIRINDRGKYYYGITVEGCHVGPFLVEELEPIPLTPEILEKNGFKACGYEELVLETDEYCFALQKGADGINAWWWEMFSSPIIPINSVHELQHCLKLVGIDKEIVL